MSIRYGLLALLEREPMHGYQLRSEFEATTGATWPLNVGQVYTTLGRLERDGLVEPVGGAADDEGRVRYRVTDDGRAELVAWFATPLTRADRPRDELAIKLALAVTTPGVDVVEVVQAQRQSAMSALQELIRLKSRSDAPEDVAWSLVLESLVFQHEAEIRWLDHCETRVLAARPRRERARHPDAQPERRRVAGGSAR